jgi:hypothetical protein
MQFKKLRMLGLVYGVLTIFQLYRGGQFYWWRKTEYPEKTTDMSQVTEQLISHIVVSSTPRYKQGSNSQL